MSRTTASGIVINESGSPDTVVSEGVPTGDSVEAAIAALDERVTDVGDDSDAAQTAATAAQQAATAAQTAATAAQTAADTLDPAAIAQFESAATAVQHAADLASQAAQDAQDAASLASAPPDTAIAAAASGANTQTRAVLDDQYQSTAAKPLAPAPTGGDDKASLQAFVNANAGRLVSLRQAASYSISGTIAVPTAGIRIDAQGATITQTADRAPLFTTSSPGGFALQSANLVGKATDYVDTTATYVSCVVRATSGAARVRLIDNTIKGFAGAAVYATDVDGLTVRDNRIIGVGNGGGGGTFTFNPSVSKDNAGIIFDGNTRNVWVLGNEISYTAQGVLGGGGTGNVHVNHNTIHDIGGQHGVYLNYGIGFELCGNIVRDVKGAGLKVQTQSGAPDVIGVAISGNVVYNAAANGIICTCASNAVPSRIRDVSITGNSIRSVANDGIVLEFVASGIASGNIVEGARAGIRVTDFTDVSVRGNRTINTLAEGVLVQSLQFSSTGFAVADNDIKDAAQSGSGTTNFGIRIAEAAGLTTTSGHIDGNDIIDTTGKVRYLIYCACASQTTVAYRNNTGRGATDYGHRGPATQAVDITGNNLQGGIGRWFAPPSPGTPGDPALTTYGIAPPTAGTWRRADRCWNTNALPGQPAGWVCTTAGSPGTWSTMVPLQ